MAERKGQRKRERERKKEKERKEERERERERERKEERERLIGKCFLHSGLEPTQKEHGSRSETEYQRDAGDS